MKSNSFGILLLLAAGIHVQAATMDFRHSEINADGFYSWSHPANWGGAVPGAGDLARLHQVKEATPYLNGDIKISSLNIGTGVHGDLAGSGVLSVSQYLNFDAGGAELSLRDKVSLEVGNRTRLSSGLTTVTLNDAAKVRTKIGFDEADAQFLVTLNGSSVLKMSLHSGARNIGWESRIVLNGDSSLIMDADTALLLYENWIGCGVTFYLNDKASLHLKPAGRHDPEFIAMFIASGGIVINGRPSATAGTDYTYDPDTGLLQIR